MNRRMVIVAAAASLALLMVLPFASCGPGEPGEETPAVQPASNDGQALLQERCATCHGLDQVKQAQKSDEEWERTVARMVDKGAQLSEEEQAVLVDYLAETYGP